MIYSILSKINNVYIYTTDVLKEHAPRIASLTAVIALLISLPNLPVAVTKIYEASDNFLLPERKLIRESEIDLQKISIGISKDWMEKELKIIPLTSNASTIDKDCQSRIYSTDMYILKIVTDENGNILFYGVISKNENFKPEIKGFKIGGFFGNKSFSGEVKKQDGYEKIYQTFSRAEEYSETLSSNHFSAEAIEYHFNSSVYGFEAINNILRYKSVKVDDKDLDNIVKDVFSDKVKVKYNVINADLFNKERIESIFNAIGISYSEGKCEDNAYLPTFNELNPIINRSKK